VSKFGAARVSTQGTALGRFDLNNRFGDTLIDSEKEQLRSAIAVGMRRFPGDGVPAWSDSATASRPTRSDGQAAFSMDRSRVVVWEVVPLLQLICQSRLRE